MQNINEEQASLQNEFEAVHNRIELANAKRVEAQANLREVEAERSKLMEGGLPEHGGGKPTALDEVEVLLRQLRGVADMDGARAKLDELEKAATRAKSPRRSPDGGSASGAPAPKSPSGC